jgi:hypothetical protein
MWAAYIQTPALAVTSYVTLGESYNICVCFLNYKMGTLVLNV